jgi:AcrR family transcriptional regulator
MEFTVKFKVSDKIYLKDPESSALGRQIVQHAIRLIHDLGFESFTFKKLATDINTTEATIYRYFENKHRLLLYIINWYWSYLEFVVTFHLQMKSQAKAKIEAFIDLITHPVPAIGGDLYMDRQLLFEVVIAEGSKVFLVKEVNEINKNQAFKPYKDLCNMVASIISEYRPKYAYPHSLGSTIMETAHNQQFFANHLPRLTDVNTSNRANYTADFLKDLVFKVL